MKPTAELFDLIKSLSASEKRYFKMNASFQKGNKNYLILFDAIEAQKMFDGIEIKRKFKREKITENLTFTKNYLYKLIFKSLNSYAEEKSVDSKLTNILNRCRILFDKALIKQYFKTVQAGKKLALKHERFGFVLEFLNIERQLTKKENLRGKNAINNFVSVYNQEEIILGKIRIINNFKQALNLLFNIHRSEGLVRNEKCDKSINSIIESLNIPYNDKADSVSKKESEYFAKQLANEIKGDSEKAYFYSKQRFEIIKSNPLIFHNSLYNDYKDSNMMMIASASNARKYKVADNLLKDFRKLHGKNELHDTGIKLFMLSIILNKCLHSQKKNEFEKHKVEFEKLLFKHKNKITVDNQNIYYFKLIKYYFTGKDYTEALRIINIFFEKKYLNFSPYLEPYIRILNILIHYELGNYKLVNYLISSTVKYLKVKGKYFKTEETVLKFIKFECGNSDKKDITKTYVLFVKELNKLKKNKYEKNAFVYFDYLIWKRNSIKEKLK